VRDRTRQRQPDHQPEDRVVNQLEAPFVRISGLPETHGHVSIIGPAPPEPVQ
jgi:hypothetical protein